MKLGIGLSAVVDRGVGCEDSLSQGIFGRAVEVVDVGEKRSAMDALVERMTPAACSTISLSALEIFGTHSIILAM